MAQDPKTGKILQPEQSPTYVETWKEMEKLLDTGKVRAIGVSNFSVQTLEVLLKEAKVVPAVNQVCARWRKMCRRQLSKQGHRSSAISTSRRRTCTSTARRTRLS